MCCTGGLGTLLQLWPVERSHVLLQVKRVIDRAEAVHGPELLDQYRADQKLIGFEESQVAVKPRVMGTTGSKNRRLGQASRAGRKVTAGRV